MSDGPTKPPAAVAALGDDDSFFDAAGALKLEFVDRAHMEPKAKAMADVGLNMNQLNRFFRHCRRIEFRLRRTETTWAKEKSEVAALSSNAADAFGKSPPKIPAEFRDFIYANVDRIHTEDDFLRGFMKHFEALMGFSSIYKKKEQRG